ncbi:MAG: peptidoglycan DD-metalloendopeptidase family protein [Thermoplasmata archaeon]
MTQKQQPLNDYGEYLRQLFLKGQGTITATPGYYSPFGKTEQHYGYDIGVPEGTQIIAPFSGKIVYSGVQGGYGQRLGIYDPQTNTTYYLSHLKQIIPKGTEIKAGELLALTGGTPGYWYSGRSTGPHVDIEIYQGQKLLGQSSSVPYQYQNISKGVITSFADKLRQLIKLPGVIAVARAGNPKLKELQQQRGGKIIRISV